MNNDELDRILTAAEPLLPSSGFATSVMDRVREAAETPPPLPFPWRRFGLGLLLLPVSAVVCGQGLIALRAAGALQTALTGALANAHVWLVLGTTLASVLGTYVLLALTLRFVGSRG
jgi:hypothetical protein